MSVNQRLVNPLMTQLFEAILLLKTKEECYEFFEDLCTVNELREKYEKIEEMTGASTATISRVKRCLAYGADGYIKVLERMEAQAEKVDNTNE